MRANSAKVDSIQVWPGQIWPNWTEFGSMFAKVMLTLTNFGPISVNLGPTWGQMRIGFGQIRASSAQIGPSSVSEAASVSVACKVRNLASTSRLPQFGNFRVSAGFDNHPGAIEHLNSDTSVANVLCGREADATKHSQTTQTVALRRARLWTHASKTLQSYSKNAPQSLFLVCVRHRQPPSAKI